MHTAEPWQPETHYLTEYQRYRLLTWADMALQQTTKQVLPETEQAHVLAQKKMALSLIIIGVDDLIGHLHEPVVDGIDDRLIRLFKNLTWLTGHPAPYAHRHFVKQFKLARAVNDQEEAFHNLFQAIVVSSVNLRL